MRELPFPPQVGITQVVRPRIRHSQIRDPCLRKVYPRRLARNTSYFLRVERD